MLDPVLDAAALEALYRLERPLLLGKLRAMVGDWEAAEDLLQDAFVKAITSIEKGGYVEQEKFAAWVSRIAKNKAMDWLRQRQRRRKVVIPMWRDQGDRAVEDTSQDRHSELKAAIARLPTAQREVTEMRLRGMKYRDIAEAMQTNINTTLGRFKYARKKLRQELSQ